MSKKYSGRIHDPNHIRSEYDIYFNDELIEEPDGSLSVIKSSSVQKISDKVIEITFESPLPEHCVIFSTYSLTIVATSATLGTIVGGYNSVDNIALRYGNEYSLTNAVINPPVFNEDRTKVTLAATTNNFNTGNAYKFIAVIAN